MVPMLTQARDDVPTDNTRGPDNRYLHHPPPRAGSTPICLSRTGKIIVETLASHQTVTWNGITTAKAVKPDPGAPSAHSREIGRYGRPGYQVWAIMKAPSSDQWRCSPWTSRSKRVPPEAVIFFSSRPAMIGLFKRQIFKQAVGMERLQSLRHAVLVLGRLAGERHCSYAEVSRSWPARPAPSDFGRCGPALAGCLPKQVALSVG